MCFLELREFGLLTAKPPFGFGNLHAFSGSGADEVGFKLGDHREDVEQQPPDWVRGIVDGPADTQLHVFLREFFDDVASVGKGTCESVEFGDDEGVPLTHRCQGLA